TRCLEGLAAPEQQPHAALELTVADDRIATEEPDRVGMPDLALGTGEMFADDGGKRLAALAVSLHLCGIVAVDGIDPVAQLGLHGSLRYSWFRIPTTGRPPFRHRTEEDNGLRNFVIISGCSGGGKSSILAELDRRGHATVPEPGRRIVEEETSSGGSALPWS